MTSNMENYFTSVAREEKREWQSVWRISLLSLDNMKLNDNQYELLFKFLTPEKIKVNDHKYGGLLFLF